MPGEADPTDRAQPRLWLVRHGETEWAAQGRHTSTTDIPLTELGRSQAADIARKLRGRPFAMVLTSPRSRALETCRLAGFAERCEVDPDLAEWDYGADEGRTTPEIRRDRPGWSIWRDGPQGGESIGAVSARADRIVDRVRGARGDVLCFGHAHQLRIVAARWLGLSPADGRLFALAPATLSVLGWERETAVVERWNEACGT